MKRTDKDVSRILREEKNIQLDPSPYAPLKKQKGLRVGGVELDDGFGAFYELDEEGQPTGRLLSMFYHLIKCLLTRGMISLM